jgi:hypothetical protein
MAKFKEFYNEGVAVYATKKITDIALRKLGLTNKILNILTGGKYYDWDKTKKDKFKHDYKSFKNRDKSIEGSDESNYKAIKYLDKKGTVVAKDNKFFKKGMTISSFTKDLQLKSRAKGAFDFLKGAADSHGDALMTILKAIK